MRDEYRRQEIEIPLQSIGEIRICPVCGDEYVTADSCPVCATCAKNALATIERLSPKATFGSACVWTLTGIATVMAGCFLAYGVFLLLGAIAK